MSASRNFYLLFSLCLFIMLLISCSSELIIQRNPAIPTAGDYKLTGTTSYTINGNASSAPISGTLSVFVGEESKSYYFLEKVDTSEFSYLATCTDEKLTISPAYESTKYQNTTYYGIQSGNGILSANRIEIDRYANTDTAGIISPTNEPIVFTMPILKHVHIIATK